MTDPAMPPVAARQPKNVIVILLDSLNRHLLGAYGGTEFQTPNIDRFAARSVRLRKHYTGSLPCMPARHDILCGALDFLWRPWGSVELWEDAITVHLRQAGVATMLVSDHPHLFEVGGENYHTDFLGWEYERGHESDPWKTRPDPSWAGAPIFGRAEEPAYHRSRGWFRQEEDFPGPKTMAATARWLDDNAGFHDRFFLFVDEFDPHEPFDTPEPYASMYDDTWEGPNLIWPPYTAAATQKGVLTERQAHQVRSCYGGKLTMIDHWFGKVLDAIERNNLWDDTAVFLCTDHGHYLGEKDIFGKPGVPVYEPLGHIPLMVSWPGIEPHDIDALTTSVDIFSTLTDVFGVSVPQRTHGASLAPLIRGEKRSIRDYALSGVWGREVHIIDETRKYARAPQKDNAPISVWSNRWSTMPVGHYHKNVLMPPPDDRAFLDRMPGSKIPVIRQPYGPGDPLPYWARAQFLGNHLYDLALDPAEDENRAGEKVEADMADMLRQALGQIEAPEDQYVRLGLE